MLGKTLYFVAPRQVEVREEQVVAPAADEVLVQSELSAISAGTEMLLYRDQMPNVANSTADEVSRGLAYPTPYGYSVVGRVVSAGPSVKRGWEGKRVFAFRPHSSFFAARPETLLEVPLGIAAEQAVFLPNAETAVNLIQDAAPMLGERALVLGLGIVGLLSTALLTEFPLECVIAADRFAGRRAAADVLGATATLNPDDEDFRAKAEAFTGKSGDGFDVVLEATGNPSALDDAVALTAYSGRVVIGSWYGEKRAAIDLGGKFHRSRMRLIASQVSTISPELSGRWNKSRRFAVAWKAIERIQPDRWITRRFSIERAAEAYRLLDEAPDQAIQTVITYD